MDNQKIQICSKCKKAKPHNAEEFKTKGTGSLSKVCKSCLQHISETNTEKKRDAMEAEKENRPWASDDALDEDDDALGLTILTLEVFLDAISSAQNLASFTALVDLSAVSGGDRYARAKELAKHVWEHNKYRFLYHSAYRMKRKPATRFKFHCAQVDTRQHQPKKGLRGGQERDKDQMDTFKCHGWLHITIEDNSNVASVKYNHEDDHIPYCNVEVPEDIQAFIDKNTSMTPTQLWDEILKIYPTPSFSRKSVYQIWNNRCSKQWKRDEDEVKSANKLIQQAASLPETSVYQVADIPLQQRNGFTAIAFSLPSALRQYGGKIREISLDSAWNTNGSRFEVYALLGELYGSGCPLGYLLIRSSEDSESGGKESYIKDLLAHIKNTWKIHAIITLTDKDTSEINAFREVYPTAKHQLCFWHCLRAIRTRLAVLRRRPKYYDVKEAKKEFNWIDEAFVPLSQVKNPSQLISSQYIAQTAIPRVTLRVDGARHDLAPKPAPMPQRLTIRLGGIVQSVVPIPPKRNENTEPLIYNPDDEDNNRDADISKQVDALDNTEDREDGPDWMFDEGETLSPAPDYIFCPAVHRKQLLTIFTTHFCQHPDFPERKADGIWTKEAIRRNAVHEMYTFCRGRGLREVWGYMWSSWYTPKMWALWARSTSPYISRLRTTMGVENYWRQLKHNYLHNTPRPRLDHLIWILIYKVTPSFMARGNILQDTFRLGRSKQLSTFQQYFKKNWKKHSDKAIGTETYIINVSDWTCTCGSQKYDCHHLCKHLVQAVPSPLPIKFWGEVRRRRVQPLYRHPALLGEKNGCDEEGSRSVDLEITGSITDGDDHELPAGDKEILKGGGGWRGLEVHKSSASSLTSKIKSGKRKYQDLNSEDEDSVLTLASSTKRARSNPPLTPTSSHTPEIFDLTASSPCSIQSLSREEFESARKMEVDDIGNDSDEELENARQDILRRAKALREAADILEKQAARPKSNRLWLISHSRDRFGESAVNLVADINRYTKTGRKRDTTWGYGKDKVSKWRVRNTMGYTVPTDDEGENP